VRDSFNSYTVDFIAQRTAEAALSDNSYYDDITKKIIATRERVSSTLKEHGFTVLPSGANFIFIKHPVMRGKDFFMYLRERNILVRHFNNKRIIDYLRVSIGNDNDMDKFLNACFDA